MSTENTNRRWEDQELAACEELQRAVSPNQGVPFVLQTPAAIMFVATKQLQALKAENGNRCWEDEELEAFDKLRIATQENGGAAFVMRCATIQLELLQALKGETTELRKQLQALKAENARLYKQMSSL